MSWIVASMAILGAALVAGFACYERRHPTSRVLALVATLAALAALGRIAFAPLPNVKPTTDIVLISGYVLGGAPGFAVGAVAALTSNLFFGQGPWTPWQMVAWGLVGVAGAALARAAGRDLGRVPLAVACGAAGLLYGAIMNVSLWVTYSGGHTWAALAAYFGTSLWFDVAHVVGNVFFCLAFGPVLVKALARYRTRFEVRWVPVAAAVAAALVVAAGAMAQPADASTGSSARYVLRAQNRDGGWGAAPGRARTRSSAAGRRSAWPPPGTTPAARCATCSTAWSGRRLAGAGDPRPARLRREHPRHRAAAGEPAPARRLVRRAGQPHRVRRARLRAAGARAATAWSGRRCAGSGAREPRRRLQPVRPRRALGRRRHRRGGGSAGASAGAGAVRPSGTR